MQLKSHQEHRPEIRYLGSYNCKETKSNNEFLSSKVSRADPTCGAEYMSRSTNEILSYETRDNVSW